MNWSVKFIMSTNIYDTANSLEKELRDSEEYITLVAAFNEVKKDEAASKMYHEFQEVQMKLQQKQMSGEQITEDEIADAQKLAQTSGDNGVIKELMESEQRLSTLIEDLNRIIMKPVQDVYQG